MREAFTVSGWSGLLAGLLAAAGLALAQQATLGVGASYQLSHRWRAEAEGWFSRSPATGFAPRNFGLAAGVVYGL